MQQLRSRGKGKENIDMTSGNVFLILLQFTLPLLVGNLFQQLYNMGHAWVVGNYVSAAAYSAVGTVTPVTDMLIGAFTGLSNGACVVISQYYGARNDEKVRQAVHTSMTLMLPLGLLFTLLGIGMTPYMLRLMKTPVEVMADASAYLMIYFAGMLGLTIYNMGAGVLRAIGDSRRPFYYLIICTVLNIMLALLFVLVLDLGVRGVAYATVCAQTVSAILVAAAMLRSRSVIRLEPRRLGIDRLMLGKIVKVGFPAALQMAVTAFSNVVVQSYINFFGADCMGGWTTYSKIDLLAFMPIKSIAMATTTFVGHNLGCGQEERAKQGVRTAMLMAVSVTVFLTSIVFAAAPALSLLFNDKPEVVAYGTLFLRMIPPFLVFSCANQVYSGALRGAGNSRAPMLLMLFSFVLFRQAYLFVMANYISNAVVPIALGHPLGWAVCSVLTSIYYHHVPLSKTCLVEENERFH